MLDGKIKVLGMREAMLPVQVLKGLNKLHRRASYDVCKQTMRDELTQNPGILGMDEDRLSADLINIFGTFGLGHLSVVDYNSHNRSAMVRVTDPDFRSTYDLDTKICDTMIAGMLAGMFTFIFGKDVNCREVQCTASGREYCEFEIH